MATWKTQLHRDFASWLVGLDAKVRTEIVAAVNLLGASGPNLGRPAVDHVKGSAFSQMKALRVPVAGEPWRVLFAFDPERSAIILVGGCKAGDKRWYKTNVPIADARFQEHLNQLAERQRQRQQARDQSHEETRQDPAQGTDKLKGNGKPKRNRKRE